MRFAVSPLFRITKLIVREPTNNVASLKNWLKLKKTENQGLVLTEQQCHCCVLWSLCISRSLRGRLEPLSAPWAEFQMVVGGGSRFHGRKNQCSATWLCCLTVSVFRWPQGCESWEHTTGRRWICSDCRCVVECQSAPLCSITLSPKDECLNSGTEFTD